MPIRRLLGGICGSSFWNTDFREVLNDMLEDETYLEQSSETIRGIIKIIIINYFEPKAKGSFDSSHPRPGNFKRAITVIGLQDNPEKGFKDGAIALPT